MEVGASDLSQLSRSNMSSKFDVYILGSSRGVGPLD